MQESSPITAQCGCLTDLRLRHFHGVLAPAVSKQTRSKTAVI